jgi:HPt (histidine-containing phosphotransfer) domain-containing protein
VTWLPPDFLEEMLHDEPESARELLSLFLEDTAANLLILQAAIRAHDSSRSLALLHSLKGSCRQIGALTMGDIAERMEALAEVSSHSVPDTSELTNAFHGVRLEIQDLLRALNLEPLNT